MFESRNDDASLIKELPDVSVILDQRLSSTNGANISTTDDTMLLSCFVA
ncbi:hypothetical protein GW750_02010 [bacterium]|nr:hypothetical protein [bacterium]